MNTHLRTLRTQAADFWMARCAVIVIVALQLLLINRLSVGPAWLAPLIELLLLIPLSIATAWTQVRIGHASHDEHWRQIARHRRAIRYMAVALTAFISVINTVSLAKLVMALLSGHAGANGESLLLDALDIWGINIVAFALWYWSIDRGGPAAKGVSGSDRADFLFPQMTLPSSQNWSPGFVDYLYVSFTNASAFSPTDTMPLTARAKLMMMAQSTISLLTVALVAARAVNILA